MVEIIISGPVGRNMRSCIGRDNNKPPYWQKYKELYW